MVGAGDGAASLEAGVHDFEIAEYCGRLSCAKPIVQPAGRGRRREFCSDTCRRAADRDYKRAKAMVEHFEKYLRRSRHEVAAYGRRAESDATILTPDDEASIYRDAAVALERARTIVELRADEADPLLAELKALVVATTPLLPPRARGTKSA
jgi:hypothetical protein